MKVLSLFDGISCGMVALERTGIPVERYVAYEIEPNAIKINQKNYPQIGQTLILKKPFMTEGSRFNLSLNLEKQSAKNQRLSVLAVLEVAGEISMNGICRMSPVFIQPLNLNAFKRFQITTQSV